LTGFFRKDWEQEPDKDDDDQTPRPPNGRNWRGVPAKESGYIQSVNNAELLRLAQDKKTVVRMEHGIGAFVVQNTTLVSLALEDPPDQERIAALQATFSIRRHRSVEQDAAFGIRQIVDMALKALSPGINDTTTAVICVDYLSAILARLSPRQTPSLYRYADGELRVITEGASFESLLAESFDQIRSNAKGNLAIMLRMLGAIQTLISLTASPQRRRALREHAQWIAELAERTLESAHDRAGIDARLALVRVALKAEPALCAGEENTN